MEAAARSTSPVRPSPWSAFERYSNGTRRRRDLMRRRRATTVVPEKHNGAKRPYSAVWRSRFPRKESGPPPDLAVSIRATRPPESMSVPGPSHDSHSMTARRPRPRSLHGPRPPGSKRHPRKGPIFHDAKISRTKPAHVPKSVVMDQASSVGWAPPTVLNLDGRAISVVGGAHPTKTNSRPTTIPGHEPRSRCQNARSTQNCGTRKGKITDQSQCQGTRSTQLQDAQVANSPIKANVKMRGPWRLSSTLWLSPRPNLTFSAQNQ